MFGSYIMFHYVRGVPFEFHGGAYDNLNMWEQIDDGAQYTPAKKFLLSVPIVLFLLSTHYTHYDLAYFTINFLAVLGVIIPKLPYVSLLLQIPGLARSGLDTSGVAVCRKTQLANGFYVGRVIGCESGCFPEFLKIKNGQHLDF